MSLREKSNWMLVRNCRDAVRRIGGVESYRKVRELIGKGVLQVPPGIDSCRWAAMVVQVAAELRVGLNGPPLQFERVSPAGDWGVRV